MATSVMLILQMDDSSSLDEKFNSQAEKIEYPYNMYGLKVNYIQIQDLDGNNVTAAEKNGSLYALVTEVQNRDGVEKEFYYEIHALDEYGNGGGGGSDVTISPYGTVLLDSPRVTLTPGTYQIEVDIPDGSEKYLRVLHLEEAN